MAQAGLGIIAAGPGALRVTENTLAALRAGRIGEQAAAWACDALRLFTTAPAVEHAIERRRAVTCHRPADSGRRRLRRKRSRGIQRAFR